jgi:hypothetical protein
MGGNSEPYDVVARVVRVTGAALLCEVEDTKIWFPRSQCLAGTEVRDVGDEGSLVIPQWLAAEKGLYEG